MPVTITSIAPASGPPGTQVTILGAGISAGSLVWFYAPTGAAADAASSVVSATEIHAVVPNAFGGAALSLLVSVKDAGGASSNSLTFALSPASFPLCTLGDVKALLGIAQDATLDDAKLIRLIGQASDQITSETRKDFQPIAITGELYDGDGTSELQLRHTPIGTVTALSIDGQGIDVSEVKLYESYIRFDDTCFEWNPRIRSYNRVFNRGRLNVAVSYTAGFLAVPSIIADACARQVIFLQNIQNKAGVMSETNSVAQATTAYSQLPLDPHVRVICNRYRTQRIAGV